MDYTYLLLGHLLGVVIFAAGHGISMALLALMRRERNIERLRAMLDMSLGGIFATYTGLVLTIGFGVAMGFAGGWWGAGWLWASIAILISIMALMMFMGGTYFSRIREAVGMEPYRFSFGGTPGAVAPEAELALLLKSPKAGLTMTLGTLALLALLVLMVLKPF